MATINIADCKTKIHESTWVVAGGSTDTDYSSPWIKTDFAYELTMTIRFTGAGVLYFQGCNDTDDTNRFDIPVGNADGDCAQLGRSLITHTSGDPDITIASGSAVVDVTLQSLPQFVRFFFDQTALTAASVNASFHLEQER